MSWEFEKIRNAVQVWKPSPHNRNLPGLMDISFWLEGDRVVKAEIQTGYTNRDIERSYEFKTWNQSLVLSNHVDAENSIFYECAFVLAVEEISGILPARRAQHIRVLALELVRVCSHLKTLSQIYRQLELQSERQELLLIREEVLLFIELLMGSRFSSCYMRWGGVKEDITIGFLNQLLTRIPQWQSRAQKIASALDHFYVAEKCAWNGVLSQELIQESGVTGPVARASAVLGDFRQLSRVLPYQQYTMKQVLGDGCKGTLGDIYDRTKIYFLEIENSFFLIDQVSTKIPSGEIRSLKPKVEFSVPAGESSISIEGPRGLIQVHVVSDGSDIPHSVQWKTPSVNLIRCAEISFIDKKAEEVFLHLATFGISVSEVDK